MVLRALRGESKSVFIPVNPVYFKSRYTQYEFHLKETFSFTIYDLLLIIWFLIRLLGVLRGTGRRLTEIYLEYARLLGLDFV